MKKYNLRNLLDGVKRATTAPIIFVIRKCRYFYSIGEELQKYQHALETTAADRDHLSVMLTENKINIGTLYAGLFLLNFQKFKQNRKIKNKKIKLRWDYLYEDEKYYDLLNDILNASGVSQAFPLPDDYIKNISAYYMACFCCRICDLSKASEYAESFNSYASIDGTDMLPFDILHVSTMARYEQIHAIRQNKSGAMIISLPKAASAFLSQSVSEVIEVPILRSSIGEGLNSVVHTRWSNQIAEGGAITHEHYRPISENVDALSAASVKDLWVLIRDPREAAHSLNGMVVHFKNTMYATEYSDADKNDIREEEFVRNYAKLSRWAHEWVELSERDDLPYKIHFLSYDEVTMNLPDVFERIFGEYVNAEVLERLTTFQNNWRSRTIERRNFRSGRRKEWEAAYKESSIRRANESISDRVRTLLNLQI
jgi:hypothetical protein